MREGQRGEQERERDREKASERQRESARERESERERASEREAEAVPLIVATGRDHQVRTREPPHEPPQRVGDGPHIPSKRYQKTYVCSKDREERELQHSSRVHHQGFNYSEAVDPRGCVLCVV